MITRRELVCRVGTASVGMWLCPVLSSPAKALAAALQGASTAGEKLSLPPDSPRWDLQGQTKVTEYLGRKSLMLDGAAAVIKDFTMRDGVIDVDVATPAKRGFFGFQFRVADDGATAEWVYLRQHKSGLPDAMQYTPVLHTGANWQLYNGPGFTGAVDIPKDEWFHLRLEFAVRRQSFTSTTWISPRSS